MMKQVSLQTQRGGTIIGIIIGLVVGLGIATLVAFYLNKSPVPFVNKAAKAPNEKGADKGGDPNVGLYGKDGKADVKRDEKKDEKKAASPEAILADKKDAAKAEPKAEPKAETKAEAKAEAKAEPKAEAKAETEVKERYFVQAGAFQSAGDADNQKAKLALMGFEAKVEAAEVDGKGTMYRVRLGPYGRLDDINRVRATLAQNGIEGAMVRSKQ